MKRRHATRRPGAPPPPVRWGRPTVPLTGEARTKRLGRGPAAREPELVLDRYRLERGWARAGSASSGSRWTSGSSATWR